MRNASRQDYQFGFGLSIGTFSQYSLSERARAPSGVAGSRRGLGEFDQETRRIAVELGSANHADQSDPKRVPIIVTANRAVQIERIAVSARDPQLRFGEDQNASSISMLVSRTGLVGE